MYRVNWRVIYLCHLSVIACHRHPLVSLTLLQLLFSEMRCWVVSRVISSWCCSPHPSVNRDGMITWPWGYMYFWCTCMRVPDLWATAGASGICSHVHVYCMLVVCVLGWCERLCKGSVIGDECLPLIPRLCMQIWAPVSAEYQCNIYSLHSLVAFYPKITRASVCEPMSSVCGGVRVELHVYRFIYTPVRCTCVVVLGGSMEWQ